MGIAYFHFLFFPDRGVAVCCSFSELAPVGAMWEVIHEQMGHKKKNAF